MHADGCAKPELVRVMWLNKVGEPPEHENHNIGYDHDVVALCPACNGGTIERLRHDCFDFESVYDQYEWYELSPEDGARMRAIAARCDTPLNPLCICDVHKSLKASALALPSSSWDAVFEWAAHRHIATIDDGPKPKFRLVSSGQAPPPPATVQHDKRNAGLAAVGTDTLLFVAVAWPLLYATLLVVYFRAFAWPFALDLFVVVVGLPVTFVVAGMVVAALAVAFAKKKP